jgi:hypothetical protein
MGLDAALYEMVTRKEGGEGRQGGRKGVLTPICPSLRPT